MPDPYRWLEDPDSPETRAWIDAQNAVTFGYLERIPARKALEKRLTELWNFERFTAPERHGERYFYTRNNGLQNQNVLYVAESLDGAAPRPAGPQPAVRRRDGLLVGWEVSDDGRYLAYGLSSAGSDWCEWKVREVATRPRPGPTIIRWIKFSGVSWTPDDGGFFYSRYDEPPPGTELTQPNYYQKLFYHRLGEPQERDTLVYQRPDQKEWGFQRRSHRGRPLPGHQRVARHGT